MPYGKPSCLSMYLMTDLLWHPPHHFPGTFVAAPYVDEFGETDFGLQRGNPLKLDQALYKELNFLWQNNNIPDKIARLQNQSRNFVPRWHAL